MPKTIEQMERELGLNTNIHPATWEVPHRITLPNGDAIDVRDAKLHFGIGMYPSVKIEGVLIETPEPKPEPKWRPAEFPKDFGAYGRYRDHLDAPWVYEGCMLCGYLMDHSSDQRWVDEHGDTWVFCEVLDES